MGVGAEEEGASKRKRHTKDAARQVASRRRDNHLTWMLPASSGPETSLSGRPPSATAKEPCGRSSEATSASSRTAMKELSKAGAAETRLGRRPYRGRATFPEAGSAGTRAGGRSPFAEAPALPLGAVPERANDTGGRCALQPSGDAHRASRSSAGAATSFGLAAPVARGVLGARPVTLATPLAEGSIRVRGRVCLRTPAPEPSGSLPQQQSLREGCSAPLRCGGGPVGGPAGRRAARHRRARPGRGGCGAQPRLQALNAPVPY